MKKKLLTENITNELEGSSLFFTRSTPPPSPEPLQAKNEPNPIIETPLSTPPQVETVEPETPKTPELYKKGASKRSDTMTPRYHDTTVSRYHDTKQPQIYGVSIDLVRKAVKEFGKEAATHRFTEAEKKEIADLIYTYKNRDIRTSENEITRISVNFIIQDYRENGENSVLHKILAALNE